MKATIKWLRNINLEWQEGGMLGIMKKRLEKGKTALVKALQYSYSSPDPAFMKFHDTSDPLTVVIF